MALRPSAATTGETADGVHRGAAGGGPAQPGIVDGDRFDRHTMSMYSSEGRTADGSLPAEPNWRSIRPSRRGDARWEWPDAAAGAFPNEAEQRS